MQAMIRAAVGIGLLLMPTLLVAGWVAAAGKRLDAAASAENTPELAVVVAAAADEEYCNGELKKVLRRVLKSCGLLGSGEVRGCQPLEAKNVATMSGDDFNALFLPLSHRAGIIQFDQNSADLDAADLKLLDETFADQHGASYFLVVSRASPEGSVVHNRELSKQRAQAVMDHLRRTFEDPDLDKEVGLLWLGEEFAQLDQEFCKWKRSEPAAECTGDDLNRSAFVTWIDCRL